MVLKRPKRPKVDGDPKKDAEYRVFVKEFEKIVKKFNKYAFDYRNLKNLNEKTLRDAGFELKKVRADLDRTIANIDRYTFIRASQGRKGRGKKKSRDDRPDEKEVKESEINKLAKIMANNPEIKKLLAG